MNGRLLVPFVCCVCALSGCDQNVVPISFESRKTEAEQRENEARRDQEAERNRLNGERQSLRMRLTVADAVVSNEMARLVAQERQVVSDRVLLTDRIKALSSADLKPVESGSARVNAVLALLDDDAVNALAMRYLHRDFRLSRLKLADDIAGVAEANRQRDSALRENKLAYEAQLKDAQNESVRAKDAAQRSLEKLKAEIAAFEDRRSKLKQRLPLVSATERKRLDRELDSLDAHLKSLRQSYDSMRSSRTVTDDRMRAGRDLERTMDAATRRRTAEEERVQRRFSGMKDVPELVSGCEEATVRALEKAMTERAAKISGILAEASKAQICIRTAASGLDGLDVVALERTRNEVEALVKKVTVSN